MRSIFAKNHGNLGGPGSVSFMFHRKGQITVPAAAASENRLLELLTEAGAEDLTNDGEHHVITTPPTSFTRYQKACGKLRLSRIRSD